MAIESRSELLPIVMDAAGSHGYQDLREQQKDDITFLEGNMFMALPTGKGLCYECLPAAFHGLQSGPKHKYIVIVIISIVALIIL